MDNIFNINSGPKEKPNYSDESKKESYSGGQDIYNGDEDLDGSAYDGFAESKKNMDTNPWGDDEN